MYTCLGVKYTYSFTYFNKTLVFLDKCHEYFSSISFMKIRPAGAELFRADGQTCLS